ncbi:hypothetical protein [Corynebacterium sp. AOP12-C2-36]|uniref:hypothetical protein n=1 Tax=Corynebacterium sp. AOP12-C2-36 TaxID=3457723 RepID=UPI004033D288
MAEPQSPTDHLPVDGDSADGSIRITVTEETVSTLHLHPEAFPDGYDLAEDPDLLVDAAVADAISYNLGDISVIERHICGLDDLDNEHQDQ